MIWSPFVSEKSDWAENLDFRGFHMFWDSTKISKFFADKKNIFFRVQKFSAHFFREKNPTFFRNLKNIGIFKNKKNTFFELEFRVQIFCFLFFWKFQYFSDFKKYWIFSRKKWAKIFWTRKNIFFVGEKNWFFCGISEHLKTP